MVGESGETARSDLGGHRRSIRDDSRPERPMVDQTPSPSAERDGARRPRRRGSRRMSRIAATSSASGRRCGRLSGIGPRRNDHRRGDRLTCEVAVRPIAGPPIGLLDYGRLWSTRPPSDVGLDTRTVGGIRSRRGRELPDGPRPVHRVPHFACAITRPRRTRRGSSTTGRAASAGIPPASLPIAPDVRMR
jgi:hypothetical protein